MDYISNGIVGWWRDTSWSVKAIPVVLLMLYVGWSQYLGYRMSASVKDSVVYSSAITILKDDHKLISSIGPPRAFELVLPDYERGRFYIRVQGAHEYRYVMVLFEGDHIKSVRMQREPNNMPFPLNIRSGEWLELVI